MYILGMEAINVILETIWNILLLVPKALLELLPAYKALSGFKQDLIAAALGVSPVAIWLLVKIIRIGKRLFLCGRYE